MARRWTDDEKCLVEAKWGIWSVKVIARHIDRTESSVINYAERNKLGSMYSEEYLLPNKIAKLFGVSETTVRRWIKQLGLPSNTRPLKNQRVHRVTQEKLLEWCKENQTVWSANNLPTYALGAEPDWLVEKRKRDAQVNTYKSREWSTKEINKLLLLVDSGMTNKEIAKVLNRSEISVKRQRTRQFNKLIQDNPPCENK